MRIIDPGHIYEIDLANGLTICLTFVKRTGGAVTYQKEWPGIQTQAVMRAVIYHLFRLKDDPYYEHVYPLWQLGSNDPQDLRLQGSQQVAEILSVLIDRSVYLNNILSCTETLDAVEWLRMARQYLVNKGGVSHNEYDAAISDVRMALWNYEARAYRRKMEGVNREKPAHDDTVDPKSWRMHQCSDVPFNEMEIEKRPIGKDGHIILEEVV